MAELIDALVKKGMNSKKTLTLIGHSLGKYRISFELFQRIIPQICKKKFNVNRRSPLGWLSREKSTIR